MSAELPPNESEPAATSLRLSEVYDSPDRVIQELAPQSMAPETRPRSSAQNNHSQSRSGPVTEVVIDRQVLHEAQRLAQGDLGRLVLRHDGTVIVANSAHHARLIRKNRHFG